jgi:ABC-type bacteriocin/lantibiotic exporter with double-glycine peptidase domain
MSFEEFAGGVLCSFGGAGGAVVSGGMAFGSGQMQMLAIASARFSNLTVLILI